MAERRWDVLTKSITEHKYKFGAEVGVLKGRNAHELLQTNPSLVLLGVDIALTDEAAAISKHFKYRFTIVTAPSLVMAARVPDESLDFVFIDADHTAEAVRADIHAWAPKVRTGGMISGHDYGDPRHPDVEPVVDSIYGDAVEIHDDSVWMVFK